MKLCECGCGGAAPIATKTYRKFGHIKGQPTRFIRGHATAKSGVLYVVDAETGCHIWQRATSEKGYGRIRVGGKTRAAHVEMYERAKGAVPPGLELDHTCNVRLCVNPDHLEPVTHAENLRRMRERNPERAAAQLQEARDARWGRVRAA